MNQKPEQPDSLDRLLAEARWDEPGPDSLARLRGRWDSLLADRSRRRRRHWTIGIAATLACVGLALWMCGHGVFMPTPENLCRIETPRHGNGGGENASIPAASPAAFAKPQAAFSTKPRPAVAPAASTRLAASPAPRPPNPYERLVLAAHRRTQNARLHRAASEPTEPDVPVMTGTSGGDSDSVAHRELWTRLLAQNDPRCVGEFLKFVEDARTSAEAIEFAAISPHPPVEALLQCLRGPSARGRVAAALVLGRLDQPIVSQELIAMVRAGVYRQEALIALLASSEPAAREFLTMIEREPAFVATLWNAKRQFQNPFPWRS
jgi:hypothetical protein